MTINKFRTILLVMASFITATVMAQDVNNFKQPYEPGQKITPNPNFIGDAWLFPLSKHQELNVPMFNVTFSPGCRNSWHKHSGGQILIATSGIGYYQEKGKPARRLFPGDIVEIAPDVEHWHGAAPDSWFAHIAIECNPETNKVTWLDPVNDNDYLTATNDSIAVYDEANKVLSPRQQAIVEIASYTGKGDLEHLPTALVKGLDAGMTVNEISEVLVQVYAYAGFPRSLRGIQTFMALLDERKKQGINDPIGREATPVADMTCTERYTMGKKNLAELTGTPVDAPLSGFSLFSPTIDKFLKEHLFADIFNRDLLTWQERELATVSTLAGVGGVEPMARSHMGICLHLGTTPAQMTALLNIIETNLGKQNSAPLRDILMQLAK